MRLGGQLGIDRVRVDAIVGGVERGQPDLGAIHHSAPGGVLDVLALRRRQFVIEQHERDAVGGDAVAQLVHFSLPEIRGGIRAVELLRETSDHLRAGRIGEAFQFEQVLVEVVLGIRPL